MFRMGWEIQIPISLSLPKKKKKKEERRFLMKVEKKKEINTKLKILRKRDGKNLFFSLLLGGLVLEPGRAFE